MYQSQGNEVSLSPFSELRAYYSGEKVLLEGEWQKKIDTYWDEQLSKGKLFRRGEVFSIIEIQKNENEALVLRLGLTDYAHYLYSRNFDLPEDVDCRVSHTSIAVETSDDFIVFGKMATHTAAPGRVQCAGGGITHADIVDGQVNYEKNARQEFFEEIGISSEDNEKVESFRPLCIKQGGEKSSVGVMFFAKLKMSKEDLNRRFLEFQKNGDEPSEFQELIYVKKTLEGKEQFAAEIGLSQENYVKPLIDFLLIQDGKM